jgi:hypothetical protein
MKKYNMGYFMYYTRWALHLCLLVYKPHYNSVYIYRSPNNYSCASYIYQLGYHKSALKAINSNFYLVGDFNHLETY